MERIKSLLGTFSKAEVRILKKYLTAFHTKGENNPLKLIEMISKKPAITAEEASKRLYGDEKTKAFIMMKSRLYEKMLEVLIMSVNNGTNRKFDQKMSQFNLNMRKNMLFAFKLKERGLNHSAEELLQKIRKTAIENGSPEMELQTLYRLREIYARNKDDQFEHLTEQINSALRRHEIDIYLSGISNRYSFHSDKRRGQEGEMVEFLEKHLPVAEKMIKKTFSEKAWYSLLLLKIYYYNLVNNVKACEETIKEMKELLDNSTSNQVSPRMAMPYYQFGALSLKTRQYKKAFKAFSSAKQFFEPNQNNYFQVSILEIRSLLLDKNLEVAESLIQALSENPHLAKSTYHSAYFKLQIAFFHFLNGEPKEAWKIILEISELSFDKTGWNIGLRIFEIMLLIELEDPDLASIKIENFRKHLSRYETDNRAKAIYRVLIALEKDGFMFSPVKNEAEFIELLTQKHPWQAGGYEVTAFDEWWLSKKMEKV